MSIITNVGVLAIFKYFNFLNSNFSNLSTFTGFHYPIPYLSILLPIGLSFHTFQSLSYTIEVYYGRQKAERHIGILAVFVMFFPQLVAGPIERPQNLLHQFRERHDLSYERVANGLKLMAWGLFKKVVIADRLSTLVDTVYNNPTNFHGLSLIISTVLFSYQIYCDFSGYSDIAIGAASVMGYKLMNNFDQPYASRSVAEFWRRWHISLSTWFRDYLYIPLGGNRVSKWRWQFNLFFVFLVSGLWHGANWTFVVWGALHGFYLIFSIWTQSLRKRIIEAVGLPHLPVLYKSLQLGLTYSMVCFAWIFFRAKNLTDALYIVSNLFIGLSGSIATIFNTVSIKSALSDFRASPSEWLIAVLGIAILEIVHSVHRSKNLRQLVSCKPIWFRCLLYYSCILMILVFGVFNESQFIYFQF